MQPLDLQTSLWASSVVVGWWGRGEAPFPFVWRDVAIVYLLSALPLAWMLATCIHRKLSLPLSVVLAVLLPGLSIVPTLPAFREPFLAVVLTSPPVGFVVRACAALGLTLSMALVIVMLIARQHASTARMSRGVAIVGIVVLLLLPWTYVGARCRHDLATLGELLEQSRFGEARTLVHGMLALDAGRTWNNHPLPRVAENIDQVVRDLESRVAVPLDAHATAGNHLERARQLAMLGRADEALAVLDSIREPAVTPHIENLRATIAENQGRWTSALELYRSARETWRSRPPSASREAGLLQATTGIAYCHRKQGHYVEAEATYQQLLAMSPTAESHFLLAQFYEDAQDSEKSQAHARCAMELSPARYQKEGEKLINKLAVFHFGCLGVYRAEADRSAGSLGDLFGP